MSMMVEGVGFGMTSVVVVVFPNATATTRKFSTPSTSKSILPLLFYVLPYCNYACRLPFLLPYLTVNCGSCKLRRYRPRSKGV